MPRTLLPALTAALLATALAATSTPGNTVAPMPSHDMSMDKNMSHYVPYTQAAFDAAKGMQRVLFFHATWCPMCKAANADLMKNLAQIPGDVIVFKTDYDKEVALKKQYGITYQHTFVLVDAQGKAMKKWSGGATKEIIAATKKL